MVARVRVVSLIRRVSRAHVGDVWWWPWGHWGLRTQGRLGLRLQGRLGLRIFKSDDSHAFCACHVLDLENAHALIGQQQRQATTAATACFLAGLATRAVSLSGQGECLRWHFNCPDPGAGPKSGSPSFLGGSIGSKHLGRVQMAKRDPTQNDRFCQNAELIWAVSFRKAAI